MRPEGSLIDSGFDEARRRNDQGAGPAADQGSDAAGPTFPCGADQPIGPSNAVATVAFAESSELGWNVPAATSR